MTTQNPSISVILPVYNGGVFLAAAIESILNQSFRDFELIAINDGSKDGSDKVIDHYAAQDSRVVAVHQQNMGLIATLNRGLEMARAPLVARMDADDIALPRRFAVQFDFMAKNPHIAVCGTNIRTIDAFGKEGHEVLYPVTPDQVRAMMPEGSPLAHPAVMMRKDAILACGGYRRMYKHAEDYDLWLRVSEKYDLANIPQTLLLYRHHDDKVSYQHAQQQGLSTFAAQLASKSRLAGKGDPTDGLELITVESLSVFNLSAKEEARFRYKMIEYELDKHTFGHDEITVANCIAQVDALRKTLGHSHFLAMFYMKCALFNVLNKHYGRALRYGFTALRVNPLFVIRKVAFKIVKIVYAATNKLIGKIK